MSILIAISMVLYVFVKFPLPFIFPGFLEIQFSDVPIIIGGYLFGVYGGIIMALARFLLKLPFSSTAFVGELADLLITIAFTISSTIIYKKSKSNKKLLISLIWGSIASIFVAMMTNQWLLIPFYVKFFYDGNFETLLNMVKPLYENVTEDLFYLYYQSFAVIPFNILRLSICSTVVYLTEQRLEKLL